MTSFPGFPLSSGTIDPVAVAAAALTGAFVLCIALAFARRDGAAARGSRGARRAVPGLARRGFTPRAIAARTRLAQDGVRTLLALADGPADRTKRPSVPATRKFMPGPAAPAGPRSFRAAIAQVVAPRSFGRA